MNTLVVNLYGGPGTGKSTNSALTFGKLKEAGISCELAHEFAKELTWEERHHALMFQPYVMGKQMWRVTRLFGKVQVIVTDSPILLGIIYGFDLPASWWDFLYYVHHNMDTLDIFLRRDTKIHPYVEAGRNQSVDQAMELDKKIWHMLCQHSVSFEAIDVMRGEETAELITERVKERLSHDRSSND